MHMARRMLELQLSCVTAQVANGLRIYFDKALPQLLLYPQEREQSAKVLFLPAHMSEHCCALPTHTVDALRPLRVVTATLTLLI